MKLGSLSSPHPTLTQFQTRTKVKGREGLLWGCGEKRGKECVGPPGLSRPLIYLDGTRMRMGQLSFCGLLLILLSPLFFRTHTHNVDPKKSSSN